MRAQPTIERLIDLIIKNNNKRYIQRVGRKGFHDKQTNRTYEGLTSVISERFPRVSRAVYRRGLRPGEGEIKERDQRASNPALGTAFHAVVLHSMLCSPTSPGDRSCVCPKGCEKIECTEEIKSMVKAAIKCFQTMNLEALCGELIILSPIYALGARCDMIALNRSDPNDLVLVSWKTSGSCPFPVGTNTAEFSQVILSPDTKHLKISTQEYIAQAHLTQLACELHMLWEGHQICITRAVIVYIYPGIEGRYRCIWLGPRSCTIEACRKVVDVLAMAAHLPCVA